MKSTRTANPVFQTIAGWFDGYASEKMYGARDPRRITLLRILPYIALHLACALVLVVGFSWTALCVAGGLYAVRMFFVTGFYHRYFSHRSFKTSRAFQFLAAAACCTAGQRGPLWWAGHHRHHHQYSDMPEDLHSPRLRGFWWAHTGWFLSNGCYATRHRNVRDWARYPELVFLDRFDWIPFMLLGLALYTVGAALGTLAPSLGTSGWQLVVWGFILSTIVLYHGTYTINSLSHQFGRRRYVTNDDSRNNFALALITLGEGWHNNHHHYPASTRQGFYWWELDLTWYLLKALSWVGLVRDLRKPPVIVLQEGRAGLSTAMERDAA